MPDESTPPQPLCFVVGPIGKDGSSERKHSDLLLNAVIKNVLQSEEFAYLVKRADEDTDPGMIGDRVVSDIINAELVVADLTDLNPNAFYELGIRHSTEKPTIHIARAGTALPFDNISHRTIFVDLSDWHSIEQARIRLGDSVRATSKPDYKVSNPITQANASFKMRQSEDPRDRIIAGLQDRMSSLESTITRLLSPSHLRASEDTFAFENDEEQEDDSNDVFTQIANALRTKRKIDAIRDYRRETGAELRPAKDFIESLERGEYIEAIKKHREVTKIGLKEAKDFVDAIRYS